MTNIYSFHFILVYRYFQSRLMSIHGHVVCCAFCAFVLTENTSRALVTGGRRKNAEFGGCPHSTRTHLRRVDKHVRTPHEAHAMRTTTRTLFCGRPHREWRFAVFSCLSSVPPPTPVSLLPPVARCSLSLDFGWAPSD
jgi:hypothetical protein